MVSKAQSWTVGDHSRSWQASLSRLYTTCSLRLRRLAVTSIAFLVASPMTIMIWALVRFGQSRSLDRAVCSDRDLDKGFQGNSNFYGLGIRIGIYLQWTATVVSHAFLPSTSVSLALSTITLSVAIMTALLIAIFSHECNYKVEVVILLYILSAAS